MTKDQEFIQSLRATFHAEAAEHLQAISSMLMELRKSPPPAARRTFIENAYREAHSLKGASRAVDLSDIEAICQAVEGVFSCWKQDAADLPPPMLDALHDALDSMQELIEACKSAPTNMNPTRREQVIGRLRGTQSSAMPAATNQAAGALPPPANDREPEKTTPPTAETVRIPLAKLDARLLQAEEMLLFKARAAQRASEMRELTGSLDQWWKQWGKVSGQVRALRRAKDLEAGADGAILSSSSALVHFLDWNCDHFRSIENKLAAMSDRADQDRHALARRVDDLLADSKQLLMLPFSTVADLFSKMVRDICRDQAKQAELTIQGGDVGIDKRILEEMKDAFIHILRNCVDHGVERPETRKQLNKPPRASIAISVCQVNGDKVEIRIADDGAGIDVAKLKKAALRQGIVSQADAAAMTDEQALSLIFHSGVSTSAMVTEISGRGLGMAIVRAKAEKLGGRVAVQSRPLVGTTLVITLPLTLATFRGILVRVRDQVFVVPTMSVERVSRVKPSEIQTMENRETIRLHGRVIALARLASVLGLPVKPTAAAPEPARVPILVLHAADQRIAFAVDEVMREEEVLVKPLRRPLTRVRNVAGATVLGNGKSAVVLNAADLMKSARAHGAALLPSLKASSQPAAPSRRVLVVEDSITSRTLLKAILETANYQVKTAVDGVDAFTALREEHFDLVVSDVEMPRMNGLDLTSRIRADDRLAKLPVVLVTALESRQERERGIDVGANAYISKSSFDQSNLLDVVRRFV